MTAARCRVLSASECGLCVSGGGGDGGESPTSAPSIAAPKTPEFPDGFEDEEGKRKRSRSPTVSLSVTTKSAKTSSSSLTSSSAKSSGSFAEKVTVDPQISYWMAGVADVFASARTLAHKRGGGRQMQQESLGVGMGSCCVINKAP